MSMPRVTRWDSAETPTEEGLRALLSAENLQPYRWSNGPYDRYGAHTHDFDKVLLVVRGSITFGLPELGRHLQLHAGDRLDLPRGTLHDALIGPDGVVCLEAHAR